jgi:hypothetical protein
MGRALSACRSWMPKAQQTACWCALSKPPWEMFSALSCLDCAHFGEELADRRHPPIAKQTLALFEQLLCFVRERRTTATARNIHSVMRRCNPWERRVSMTANTTFFVAQRGGGTPRRPSTRCCSDSCLPGTPVRYNIRLKSAAIWGMPH